LVTAELTPSPCADRAATAATTDTFSGTPWNQPDVLVAGTVTAATTTPALGLDALQPAYSRATYAVTGLPPSRDGSSAVQFTTTTLAAGDHATPTTGAPGGAAPGTAGGDKAAGPSPAASLALTANTYVTFTTKPVNTPAQHDTFNRGGGKGTTAVAAGAAAADTGHTLYVRVSLSPAGGAQDTVTVSAPAATATSVGGPGTATAGTPQPTAAPLTPEQLNATSSTV
jgi:hypothetical protein